MADRKYIAPLPVLFAPPPPLPSAPSFVEKRLTSARRYAAQRVQEVEESAQRDGCLRYLTPQVRQVPNPVQLSGVQNAQQFAKRWNTIFRYIRKTLDVWQEWSNEPLIEEDDYIRLWNDIMQYKPKVVTLGRSLYRFINRYANDYIVRDEAVFQQLLDEESALSNTFPFRDKYLEGINQWLDRVKAVSASIGTGASISEALQDFYLPWNAAVWQMYFAPGDVDISLADDQDQAVLQRYRQEHYEDETNQDIDRTNEWFQELKENRELDWDKYQREERPSEYKMALLQGGQGGTDQKRIDPLAGWVIRQQTIQTPSEFWSAIGFSPNPSTRGKQLDNVCRGAFGSRNISEYIQKYTKAYPRTELRAISLHKPGEEKQMPFAFALLASRWMAGNMNYFVPARGEEKWLQRRVVDEKEELDVPLTLALDAQTPVWELAYVCASPEPKGGGRRLIQWLISQFAQDQRVPMVLEVADNVSRDDLVGYYASLGFHRISIQAQKAAEKPFKPWHTQVAGVRGKVVPLLMRYKGNTM